jgi:hypothetical protein
MGLWPNHLWHFQSDSDALACLDMAEIRSSNWKWWALVAGLGFAHFVVVLYVDIAFSMPSPRPRPIGGPPYQPPWHYYAFLNILAFPASVIFRIARPGPGDGVFGLSILMVTCFLWGCLWAEPFRRRAGWKPWRFSTRELLVITTIIAMLLGMLVLLN